MEPQLKEIHEKGSELLQLPIHVLTLPPPLLPRRLHCDISLFLNQHQHLYSRTTLLWIRIRHVWFFAKTISSQNLKFFIFHVFTFSAWTTEFLHAYYDTNKGHLDNFDKIFHKTIFLTEFFNVGDDVQCFWVSDNKSSFAAGRAQSPGSFLMENMLSLHPIVKTSASTWKIFPPNDHLLCGKIFHLHTFHFP